MSWRLHIRGQVQGVGFRPFVWRLAQEQGLDGWVNNAADGVHIGIQAEEARARHFLERLLAEAPPQARITCHSLAAGDTGPPAAGFRILPSPPAAQPDLLLSPDFAPCEACLRELLDPQGRRLGYPFITCTQCGPRFSISRSLPYDRERTAMAPFEMCEACAAEYADPADRRFFSQTNSCARCGVRLSLWDSRRQEPESGDSSTLLASAARRLLAGEILAVQGVGGFLLLCDATSAESIGELRRRKRRPSKPLALLYEALSVLEGDAEISALAREALLSSAAPVVLLPLRPEPASGICSEALAPGLGRIGAMLPSAPLLALLARAAGRPLVATSANLSGSPIFYQAEEAQARLGSIADAFLSHNREIVAPQDDSVVQVAGGQALLLRRGRGHAPGFFLPAGLKLPPRRLLALGAQLKSAFAWQQGNTFYLSPYLGDLESADAQERYEQMLGHFERLLGSRPGHLLSDLHPDYFSTELARELSRRWEIPLAQVQHHEAHFAALLGEQGLLECEEPVLGLIWDGTGLGHDGQLWGGEFLVSGGGRFRRAGHLGYFPQMLGDKMAREPRIAALSLCRHLPEAGPLLEPHFSSQAWDLYQRMAAQPALLTSSMGRLFDGVACLLGLGASVSYEGEAAMRLEALAGRHLSLYPSDNCLSLSYVGPEAHDFSPEGILQPLLEEVRRGGERGRVAARFHLSLVQWAKNAAAREGCRIIACSGGVFQNGLLCDLMLRHLSPEHRLLFHRQLPPNDENIAFGQICAFSYSSHQA